MTNSPFKGMSIKEIRKINHNNKSQWIKSTNSDIVQEVSNATRSK